MAALSMVFEKIASKDKDYRYMATSDLLNELQKDTFHMDGETERKICALVLHQMDDVSGDISNLAVKCLVPLVKRVPEARLFELVDGLAGKLLGAGKSAKEPQHDMGAIGLKTVVGELAATDAAAAAIKRLAPKLTAYLSSPTSKEDVKSEALDILADCLTRFGPQLAPLHEKLKGALIPQLEEGRAGLRKRTITCLAALAGYMPDGMLTGLCEHVITTLQSTKTLEGKRTYVQLIGAISRSVGYRFGKFLPAAMPQLGKLCAEAGPDDDEMREHILQALESMVRRCPREVTPFVEEMITLSLTHIKYDPNFTGDDDDDEQMDVDDEDDDDNEDSEGEYSDDEDSSWKTRRAAARCLSAIITSRPELLGEMYTKACPILIARFKEREETVKIDIFSVFVDLLRQTNLAAARASDADAARAPLRATVPALMKGVAGQLKERSLKTKVAVLTLLKELVMALPAGLTDSLAGLLPAMEKALSDKASNSNVKIEALLFLRLAMASHPPEVFQTHLKLVAPAVFAAVGERYYKVTSGALRVCVEMIRVVRPSADSTFDFSQYTGPLYAAIEARLTAQDQDAEVKECAITCMGQLVAVMGDALTDHLPACLQLLLERLRNEITRLAAVKAKRQADLSQVTAPVVQELASFMRKANRALRLNAMQTLDAFVVHQAPLVPAAGLQAIITEAAALISDADLQLTSTVLKLCNSMLAADQSLAESISTTLLPPALKLVQSTLLQGSALRMLNEFFAVLVHSGAKIVTFESLLERILAAGRSSGSKQAGHSVAVCVAGLCLASGEAKANATIKQLIDALKSSEHMQHELSAASQPSSAAASQPAPAPGPAAAPSRKGKKAPKKGKGKARASPAPSPLPMSPPDVEMADALDLAATSAPSGAPARHQQQLLALLCLGEIGRRTDLSKHKGLEVTVTEAFHAPSEELKAAAAYALGSIAVGNLDKYLPYLLEQITSQPKLQYFLLSSLKEVITPTGPEEPVVVPPALVERTLELLMLHCTSDEEAVRNVVADCLGKLTLLDAARLIPALQGRLTDTSANARATMVLSLKGCITDKPQPVDAALAPALEKFLLRMEDDDRVLNVGAHNKPSLIQGLLPTLMPLLYQQTVQRPDLVRVVDLGPFKHTVDDGLELRKSAFECLDTLLDSYLDCLDAAEFLKHLQAGAGDHYDIKLPCHLMLTKLAGLAAPTVLSHVDTLVEPLEKTLLTKLKTDAVKQEVDRNEDMLRSALRAIDALSRMPDVETCQRFQTFLTKTVLGDAAMAQRFKAVRSESDTTAVDATGMET